MTAALALAALSTSRARADEAPAAPPDSSTRLSIETDPSSFVLSGFSAFVTAKPGSTRHLRVGAGALGLQFPQFLVPHLNRTGEDGWGLDVRAVMGFAAYQVGDRKGLYIGAYTGWLEANHTRDDMPGTASRDMFTVLPTIGYQWFPFTSGALSHAFIQPWAGATVWIPVGGSSTLGSHTFKDPYVVPLAAVNLGFEL